MYAQDIHLLISQLKCPCIFTNAGYETINTIYNTIPEHISREKFNEWRRGKANRVSWPIYFSILESPPISSLSSATVFPLGSLGSLGKVYVLTGKGKANPRKLNGFNFLSFGALVLQHVSPNFNLPNIATEFDSNFQASNLWTKQGLESPQIQQQWEPETRVTLWNTPTTGMIHGFWPLKTLKALKEFMNATENFR